MPTTTNYALYTPPLTGVTPDIPRDTKTLADAIDAALKAEETARIAATTGALSSRTHAAATSIPNNTATPLPFDTMVLDEITWDATNNRFTAPTAGYYQVNAVCCFTANTTGVRIIRIAINGIAIATFQVTGTSTAPSAPCSWAGKLAAGDTIQVQVFQNSGGALTLTGGASYNRCDVTRVVRG